MKKNIALIGFMGTGKSAVGGIIAETLKMNFYDSDNLIEAKMHLTINSIFLEKGESFFRQLESAVLEELSLMENIVISAGGGAVLNKKNIENLKKNSVIITLTASPEIIHQRIKNNSQRPLLKKADPLQEIKRLLEQRKSFYEAGDFIFNTDNFDPYQTADLITSKFETLKYKG